MYSVVVLMALGGSVDTPDMGRRGGGGCCGCYGGGGMIRVMPGSEKVPGPDKKKSSLDGPAPATIVVSLPADAKLMIDSYQTTSTSSRRVFVTPDLEPGQDFTYTLKAEANGKTVTQKITVRAGVETPVTLDFPAAVAAR